MMNNKTETKTQTFSTNGLVPPKHLHINFKPSSRQYDLWRCLEPNSCNLCGGEIIRTKNPDANGATKTIPTCAKCGNDNIPQIVLGGGSAGGGKAALLDSDILTPYGFKKLIDIKAGDELISPTTGEKQKVLCLHPIDTFNFYRISFEDGTHFDCSEGHLWVAWRTRGSSDIKKLDNGEWQCEQLWETKQMYEFLEEKKKTNSTIRLKIPVTKPANFYHYGNKDKRPIDPYLMGAFLGDGSATESCGGKPTFSNGDLEMLSFFQQDGSIDETTTIYRDIKGSKDTFFKLRFTDPKFYEALVKMGLYGKGALDKFIPKAYKYAPLEDRYKLIQGLIDTDAEVDTRGHITYTTISKQLAEDFAFVTRSLGCVSTITKRSRTGYKDKDGVFVQCNDAYNVQVRSWDNKKLMRLSRKVSRCKEGFNGGKSPLGKQITNIEYIGKREGRCITVDKTHGLYIADNFTVTHNSYVGSMWILSSCMKYAGIRAVVARRTLSSLEESTWNTLRTKIMDMELGLQVGKHFKEDKKKGEITLWNGSKIIKKELDYLPSDPRFERLGSSEFTIAFVDEVSEISETAIEVLYSRLRWLTPETFRVPKLFLSTNPSPNWVRDRFVQDKRGEPVKLRKYDKYVQFSVFDNPKKDMVETYALQLDNLRNPKEKQRLLYGNWDFMDSSENAIYASFDGDKHLEANLMDRVYDPMKPLIFVFDFNVIPHMSVLVCQIDYDKNEIYVLQEMSGEPKNNENSTPAMARKVAEFIKELGHMGGVVISGDATGDQRASASEIGTTNYSIITGEMYKNNISATLRVLSKNPPQKTRTEFINTIFEGKTDWRVIIDLSCRDLTSDFIMQEQNSDGTKNKKKVTDPDTGLRYEKYGHFSDNFDYLICTFIQRDWELFSKGRLGVKYDSRAIISRKQKRKWNY